MELGAVVGGQNQGGALAQLVALRDRRVERAETEVPSGRAAVLVAREERELSRQAVAEYAERQAELIAACYAPVLGRETNLQAVEDARTDAAEVLVERSRLEEASRLAAEVVAERETALEEARHALRRLERKRERALLTLQERATAAARKEEERQADLLLDGLTEARFARSRR